MKFVRNVVCVLLMFGLGLLSAHGAAPIVPASSGAKAKATAKAKVKAKAKAKAKAKPKVKAKATAKVTESRDQATSSFAAQQYPADEGALDAEVAAARKIVAVKSNDVGARERLARSAVVLVDWLLRVEAVGDVNNVQRLSQKLHQDLHDTGWRVQKMSQRGDVMAKQAEGFLLAHGVLLKKDVEKSCVAFLAAAERLAPAGWHAAHCLMTALPDEAWSQMERAARRGHAGAQEWMGRRCLGEFGRTEKDFVCARTYLEQSASLGRPRAQTLWAFLLTTGQGGPVDVSRAAGLYRNAAEQGDIDAQNNLGEIYETGRGVSKNLDEALLWYGRAAEKGLGSAQFNAGRLWAIGAGEKKDPAKARALLLQADAKGIVQARQVLDWLDRQAVSVAAESPGLKPASMLGGDSVKE
jgi:TPR repeat protein